MSEIIMPTEKIGGGGTANSLILFGTKTVTAKSSSQYWNIQNNDIDISDYSEIIFQPFIDIDGGPTMRGISSQIIPVDLYLNDFCSRGQWWNLAGFSANWGFNVTGHVANTTCQVSVLSIGYMLKPNSSTKLHKFEFYTDPATNSLGCSWKLYVYLRK